MVVRIDLVSPLESIFRRPGRLYGLFKNSHGPALGNPLYRMLHSDDSMSPTTSVPSYEGSYPILYCHRFSISLLLVYINSSFSK